MRRLAVLVYGLLSHVTFLLTFLYAIVTNLCLCLQFWQWRAMPDVIWHTNNEIAIWTLTGISLLGWALVVLSTFLINHSTLFGLSQIWRNYTNKPPMPNSFVTPSLYKLCRHPMYVGFFLAFWSTPDMTVGHLLFAVVTSVYIVFEGILFEEPDLASHFSSEYPEYQRKVRMFLPLPRTKKGASDPGATTA
ncbi:MAG: methyltransferase family protein [Planctomycetota bacterium]